MREEHRTTCIDIEISLAEIRLSACTLRNITESTTESSHTPFSLSRSLF